MLHIALYPQLFSVYLGNIVVRLFMPIGYGFALYGSDSLRDTPIQLCVEWLHGQRKLSFRSKFHGLYVARHAIHLLTGYAEFCQHHTGAVIREISKSHDASSYLSA